MMEKQIYGKKLLSSIINEVPLMIELLNNYGPVSQGNSPRAAKRTKTTEYAWIYFVMVVIS
jgi:U3 small nucleolar RNA-associated protein 10